MSRRDTMQEEHWRVRVVDATGRDTHGSGFKTQTAAENYYGTLAIAGSEKRLEVRRAGTQRYAVERREVMQ